MKDWRNTSPGYGPRGRRGRRGLRILILSQYFWPENFRINDLAVGLVKRGHRVTVLTGQPNYPGGTIYPGYGFFSPRRQEFGGVEVVRVPLWPRGKGGKGGLVANFLSFALSACLLGSLWCRGRYDLIFVHEPSPITIGIPARLFRRLKGIPMFFWIQDLWPESLSATGGVRSHLILNLVGRLVRWIYRGTDRILVSSRAFIPSVEAMGGMSDRIFYFPQTAEPFYQPLVPQPSWPEAGRLPQGFIVLFAGNLGAAQGIGTILVAAEQLQGEPEIHWVILGDGRMRAWVEEEIRFRGLTNVHLLGSFPVETMPRFFALSDVLLMTLRRDPLFALTVPGKLQSYLACGRPIVAAMDGEGARIVREAQAGLSCPAEDAEGVAAAILELYRRPVSERQAMGERGRRYFERHFDRERLLDRLLEWMEEDVANG